MTEQLATVQLVAKLEPIDGADRIEKATILGWSVVVKKGELKEGDLCIYFDIDSILPDKPEYDFINKRTTDRYRCADCRAELKAETDPCYTCGSLVVDKTPVHVLKSDRSRKLSTKKIRGVFSQGLVLPIDSPDRQEGDDLTEELGVTKYEKPIPGGVKLGGITRSTFPIKLVPKTDEIHIQKYPKLLKEIAEVPCYVTVKMDGSSATYIHHNGSVYVCSRNMELTESDTNTFWIIAKKYGILEKLRELGNIAIQGELCGPGIQRNPLNLKTPEFYMFNVYFIDKQEYGGLYDLIEVAKQLGVPTVPIEHERVLFSKDTTIDDLMDMAHGKYEGTNNLREGIVVRLVDPQYSNTPQGMLSFKVVDKKFLLKNKE